MEKPELKKLLTNFSAGDESDNYQALTEEQVNEISNMFELLSRWHESLSGLDEEKFIENRINQLIGEVILNNTPDWFLFLITTDPTIPNSSEDILISKVEELLEAISS